MVVRPDGKYVYVAGPGSSSIAIFRRDLDTGKLEFESALRNAEMSTKVLAHVNWLAVSPVNTFLYTTSTSHVVAMFKIREDEIGKAK